MTKAKKAEDWADSIVGASDLPEDDFTFTEGSNYGLDGFNFDTPPNEGVEQGARLPQVKGLSGLPDGFVPDPKAAAMPDDKLTEDEWGFDLTTMLSEEEGALPTSREAAEAASAVDLSWLDPTQEQDPKRLPKGLAPEKENHNQALPELVEAWGDGKDTTGLVLVPGIKEREVLQYEKEISETEKSGLPGSESKRASVREAVLRAMRRSTFGIPFSKIKAETAEALGADAPRAKRAMALIEAEHGLAGNVFVRAVAFPGIKNGKWVKELRRSTRTARYVITDDPAIADKLKLEAVSEVPWKRALKHYRPRLKAAGYKVAGEGDPRAVLLEALQAGPEAASVPSNSKPVAIPPADRVSAEEARQAFQEAPPQEREVVDASQLEANISRKKALVQIARWVKKGLLESADALRIRESGAPPRALVKAAAKLITASGRTDIYKDAAFKPVAYRPELPSKTVDRKQAERVARFVRQQMSEGLAGPDLDAMIQAKFAKPVRTASQEMVDSLRQTHEGLSGHLYVDAAAYMSPTGSCEEGALKHRANGLKHVLAAEPCGGCFHAANGRCKMYRKLLAKEAPTKDPEAYQRKMIAAASASDAEITASYFDASEFDLGSSLEDIDLKEAASTEELGEVLFGEMEV
jgi:hypothetical protein